MRYLLVILFCACGFSSQAQLIGNRLMIGVGFYGMNVVGDLNKNSEFIHRIYPGGNFSLQLDAFKLISPQLNIGFGRYVSQDRNLKPVGDIQPNKFSETTYVYVDALVRVRFLRRKRVRPHLGAGIGLLYYVPRDKDGAKLIEKASTRQPGENYGNTTPYIPFNVGVTIRANDMISFGLDFFQQVAFTDYFDNIGKLGTRKGFDSLQRLQTSIYLTFGQKHRQGRDGR